MLKITHIGRNFFYHNLRLQESPGTICRSAGSTEPQAVAILAVVEVVVLVEVVVVIEPVIHVPGDFFRPFCGNSANTKHRFSHENSC